MSLSAAIVAEGGCSVRLPPSPWLVEAFGCRAEISPKPGIMVMFCFFSAEKKMLCSSSFFPPFL